MLPKTIKLLEALKTASIISGLKEDLLMSVRLMYNSGCTVTFSDASIIISKDNKIVFKGTRKIENGLYYIKFDNEKRKSRLHNIDFKINKLNYVLLKIIEL